MNRLMSSGDTLMPASSNASFNFEINCLTSLSAKSLITCVNEGCSFGLKPFFTMISWNSFKSSRMWGCCCTLLTTSCTFKISSSGRSFSFGEDANLANINWGLLTGLWAAALRSGDLSAIDGRAATDLVSAKRESLASIIWGLLVCGKALCIWFR